MYDADFLYELTYEENKDEVEFNKWFDGVVKKIRYKNIHPYIFINKAKNDVDEDVLNDIIECFYGCKEILIYYLALESNEVIDFLKEISSNL